MTGISGKHVFTCYFYNNNNNSNPLFPLNIIDVKRELTEVLSTKKSNFQDLKTMTFTVSSHLSSALHFIDDSKCTR